MSARTRVLLPGLLLSAGLLGSVLLAGCSGSSDSSSSRSAGAASSGAAEAGPALEPALAGAPSGAAVAPVGSTASVAVGRAVVRTAELRVEVRDVRPAADRARVLAESSGGGLESEDAGPGEDVLRLRVAPDRLATVLDGLAALGRETARSVGSQDVTEQVVDLDSRLATARASVARVRALLDRATALSDVVALEGQLSAREADLESLQRRLEAVRGQADLATVTLTLETPAVVAAAADPGFGDGLGAGLAALRVSARAAAVVGGAALPFLPVLAVVLVLLRRRRTAPSP